MGTMSEGPLMKGLLKDLWAGQGSQQRAEQASGTSKSGKHLPTRAGQGRVCVLGVGEVSVWAGHRAGWKISETIYLGAQMENDQDADPRL